jgi:hypothetical protein
VPSQPAALRTLGRWLDVNTTASVRAQRPQPTLDDRHYIELYHNTRRRHSALGMLTPTEYENYTTRPRRPPDSRTATPSYQGLDHDLRRLGGTKDGETNRRWNWLLPTLDHAVGGFRLELRKPGENCIRRKGELGPRETIKGCCVPGKMPVSLGVKGSRDDRFIDTGEIGVQEGRGAFISEKARQLFPGSSVEVCALLKSIELLFATTSSTAAAGFDDLDVPPIGQLLETPPYMSSLEMSIQRPDRPQVTDAENALAPTLLGMTRSASRPGRS